MASNPVPLYDTRIGRDRLVHETGKAILVRRLQSRSGQPLGPDAPTLWIPKRHVRSEQAAGRSIETLHVPMWLCQADGL